MTAFCVSVTVPWMVAVDCARAGTAAARTANTMNSERPKAHALRIIWPPAGEMMRRSQAWAYLSKDIYSGLSFPPAQNFGEALYEIITECFRAFWQGCGPVCSR